MIRIVTLLLIVSPFFASCQKFLGLRSAHNYNVLVENGTFSPATSAPGLNEAITEYRNSNYNWLIDFNMNNFYGYFPQILYGLHPAATTFDVASVNVESWAIAAAARGVDYTFLTAINEYGFLLYESEVDIPGGAFITPRYHVTGSADKTIMTKYVTEFRERGIEPGVYINVGWIWNLSEVFLPDLASSNPTYYAEIVHYLCLLIQEMHYKFGIKVFWMDSTPGREDILFQSCYNALKSVAPNSIMLANSNGSTTFSPSPYDVGSTEEYHIKNGSTAYQSTTRTKSSINYYIPQEIIATPYADFSEWYYVDEDCYLQPIVSPFDFVTPFVKMQAQPIEDYQDMVDASKTYNVPFTALMMINRYGELVEENLDFLDSIDFSRP